MGSPDVSSAHAIDYMREAVRLAGTAAALGEVPVGAVVVRDGVIIGRGYNRPISGVDPTAHAEIVALRQAAAYVGNYRLTGADLYVTVEPCTMCAGALVHARIARLVFGTREPRAGAVISTGQVLAVAGLNHRVEVIEGVLGDEAQRLMVEFFRERRTPTCPPKP
ncbi:tRNA-specific adenosine deaminase [Luteitalea pratensis]|uniref:tRNA-specific adenosine deaminase n=1 Tax=Luteitalea pratensis TaxID=1855912 RepID=A0A143PGG8_LUTPR|nr:tRNA adenosine(34) deaminase TadA [Luteitalea pratensis]AMY07657.1 tRNA-specific adenosine deaminase [Luteitalea pratensis]